MDLTTSYLGLTLRSPLVPSASPLSEEIDSIRRMEDAGAAAVVLYSLFEEQLVLDRFELHHHLTEGTESFAEALTYFPEPTEFHLGPEGYLEHIRKAKAAVDIPIIASLNGSSLGGWTNYAKQMQDAGADALELNVFTLGSNPVESGAQIELRTVQMVQAVRKAVRIPVAVKLSPYYASLAHFATKLDEAGADGLVLFNRFYQPDIDVEELTVRRQVHLSSSAELPLRLTWLALLSPNIKASLAASGGIHTVIDAVQAVMAGAHAIQLVSVLLKRGPSYIATLRQELSQWLEEHEYHSLRQAQGSMNLNACPDPQVYSRANYMLVLQSWRDGQ
jgi:dihydroorotate dehydrogenase (fumarate)